MNSDQDLSLSPDYPLKSGNNFCADQALLEAETGTAGRLPGLQNFFEILREELDPDQQIDQEYRTSNDPAYLWKAARLIGRADNHQIRTAIDLDNYVFGMKK